MQLHRQHKKMYNFQNTIMVFIIVYFSGFPTLILVYNLSTDPHLHISAMASNTPSDFEKALLLSAAIRDDVSFHYK